MAARLRPLVAAAVGLAGVVVSVGAAAGSSAPLPSAAAPSVSPLQAALARADTTEAGPLVPQAAPVDPQDRYAPAGGCYTVRSVASGGYLTRGGAGFVATGTAATAEPVRFQAFDLGKYLLFAGRADFVAQQPDAVDTRVATGQVADRVRGTGDESLQPARQPLLAGVGAVDAAGDGVSAATRSGNVVAAAKPSGAAEWLLGTAGAGRFTLRRAVDDHDEAAPGPVDPPVQGTLTATTAGALSVVAGSGTGPGTEFTLAGTTGCAAWPEIETQATGPYPTGATPYGETAGYIDAHLHMMAFEFLGGRARCGRPWHPYGVTYALVDCPDHEPGGRGALLEDIVSGHTPGAGHDTVGWPTFGYWPNYDSLTHEQVYWKWLERAWRGGLRMTTTLLVDNGVLCEVWAYKKNSCNEMDGIRLQAQRLHEFERYIDAQYGGPGHGWLRIVTDPFEARRIVNAGKLAVVMGIEVSVPFDCGETLEVPRCTAAELDQRLQGAYDLGVRQMELTNKFDNALTGVTGDGGSTGLIVNAGNRYETGHFWKMTTCSDPGNGKTDNRQYNIADESGNQLGRDAIFGAVLEIAGVTGAAPVYPGGPHCNAIGLSDLGRRALDGLARHGMIFDPDHMSASARTEALDHLAAAGYSGILSSHSWADNPTYERIQHLGGVVTPHAGSSTGIVGAWRKLAGWQDPRFTFGLGWGSDVNGFSGQGGPRNPKDATAVSYPFTALGGVQLDKQVSGTKTYDFNTSGVDHYGLYPDWVEDGRKLAGKDGAAYLADLQRGPEAYLQMWERAIGVPRRRRAARTSTTCRRWTPGALVGRTAEQVLAALGQPHTRMGSVMTYCTVAGQARVEYGSDGLVSAVGSGHLPTGLASSGTNLTLPRSWVR